MRQVIPKFLEGSISFKPPRWIEAEKQSRYQHSYAGYKVEEKYLFRGAIHTHRFSTGLYNHLDYEMS